MGKVFSDKKLAFVMILIVFALLYASVSLQIPTLGYVGVIGYAVIALLQSIKL
ncbi:MAG: hypothetical protein QM215_07695 [Bacillota bacterium]|jgi:hypothetical protein|nr:hypothetical protein [Eubacteriales bacterium]MDI9492779.1 hypothetical protein [Bacillota bacterium]NLV70802.1 hypothetical protein [Clostridiales bacterium]HRV33498.1 hypothetical protein [Anaerovoracaceae bacterium]MDD3537634.1 hypothetical protein [Eubacteriales bacterium]